MSSNRWTTSPPDTYVYDGDGHRVRRTVGSTVTNYVYDGGSVVAEYSASGALRYDLPGVGWVAASGNVQWYSLHNMRGDTVATYDGANADTVRDWDAYGGFYTLKNGTDTDFRYVGDKSVVWDASTQFYSMGRRSYSWRLGRFLTQDPIGYAGGTTNLYSYCGDNPVTRTDPGGTEPEMAQRMIREERAQIFAMAKKYNVPPVLVAGIIFSESIISCATIALTVTIGYLPYLNNYLVTTNLPQSCRLVAQREALAGEPRNSNISFVQVVGKTSEKAIVYVVYTSGGEASGLLVPVHFRERGGECDSNPEHPYFDAVFSARGSADGNTAPPYWFWK